jgi:PAS fold
MSAEGEVKMLASLLARTANKLGGSIHPRFTIVWQGVDMVYTQVYAGGEAHDMQIVGNTVTDIFDDNEQTQALLRAKKRVLKTGKMHRDIYRLSRGDDWRMLDITIQPLTSPTGTVEGMMSVLIDMTDIAEAKQRLGEANERLVELLDQLLDEPNRAAKKRYSST